MTSAETCTEQHTLSTGHSVELPLECTCTVAGATFTATADRLNELLPTELTPIRIGPRTGLLSLVSIEYHAIGEFDPYNEFAVIIPAARNPSPNLPILPFFTGEVGGYVHYLPVTTDASVALGTELWGYPKERADILIADSGSTRRTVVKQDGDPLIQLDVGHADARRRELTMHSYTVKDEELVRTRVNISGELAVRPLSQKASCVLGDHPRAAELRSAGLGERPLARLYGTELNARVHPGERSETQIEIQ